ncbi:DUF4450 domain-containing protein [Terrimonas sp. NA20]|uniref:DUF4450 domain-containing protein n=1 Tax=Terrimonas ginsenosidimutans TaxID=2908004 RepID=A0ABS9KU83_9BACT|nr:DUF4450 domain-containing protein [Terrimonas ginsenosidimutans]MCG2615878.1 DUF4450 domain-containing protein [Terrimonas ginsenosidimutans]
MKITRLIAALICLAPVLSYTQEATSVWHGIQRKIHYVPDHGDFLCVDPQRRFNRALYGSNTAFRVEAGDLPEFALYLPGMGGNLKFGLISGDRSKWLINANKIETRYRPGSMIYSISDPLLGKGKIGLTVLPLFDREAVIVKLETTGIPDGVTLLTAFGGVTGRKFSRDGDIGADPESSFDLKPAYCNNIFAIQSNKFSATYGVRMNDSVGQKAAPKSVHGLFPTHAVFALNDPGRQVSPSSLQPSVRIDSSFLSSTIVLKSDSVYYFFLQHLDAITDSYSQLPGLFVKAESERRRMSERVRIDTPDPFINTLGGALSMAADAIWESPSYMHGAVAWRMRLNGWRGAYVADALGWHDRAKLHFNSYALSQVTKPLSGPVVMDTALHLARGLEKMGTSMFSNGYISRNPNGDLRPHHYDMNLVFTDQLLNHLQWTGDTAYARKMWPLLERHLAWEKRNFDADGDGLYDAYAAIWASDALQYSGGGVTHSSAYNYKANRMAAEIARILKIDGAIYEAEAQKILQVMHSKLWVADRKVFAEYKDLLGGQLLHPSPGLWTIYHTIDSKVGDPMIQRQLLHYIDQHIPHIPVRANGLNDTTLFTLATSNWQPYTWSLNNVALAELMHTSLAYWQGGNSEKAFALWKSSLVESMYLGASPGNFQQLSFYDAMRGELYRDFADPVAMTARSLVEGLFGVNPDALHDTLVVSPGLPEDWKNALIETPDISFSINRTVGKDEYYIRPDFPRKMNLSLRLSTGRKLVAKVEVNGRQVKWSYDAKAIGSPVVIINLPQNVEYKINVTWKKNRVPVINTDQPFYLEGDTIKLYAGNRSADIGGQGPGSENLTIINRNSLKIKAAADGQNEIFIKMKREDAEYFEPVKFFVAKPLSISAGRRDSVIEVRLWRYGKGVVNGQLFINGQPGDPVQLDPHQSEVSFRYPLSKFKSGSNLIRFTSDKVSVETIIQCWENKATNVSFEKIDIAAVHNDRVTNIFRHQYLSPRPAVTTLQLPVQGIGNWAYPMIQPEISDSGLRKLSAVSGEILLPQGIPFSYQADTNRHNISFVSTWDNFPDSATIPLKGKAKQAYLLMAGTTNPMQSQMLNGTVQVRYTDGTTSTLFLKNPENWWPIEQDLFNDDFAFRTNAPVPLRVHLKTGVITDSFANYTSIKGFTNRAVDGGAATVLDLPLDDSRELKSITIKAVAKDVLIGLIALTLQRH